MTADGQNPCNSRGGQNPSNKGVNHLPTAVGFCPCAIGLRKPHNHTTKAGHALRRRFLSVGDVAYQHAVLLAPMISLPI